MSAHTKGPWVMYTDGGDADSASAIGVSSCVNDVAYCDIVGLQEGEIIANTRLIAAAPDLLEALEMVEARMVEHWKSPENHPGSAKWGSEIDKARLATWLSARAAIAKAKGEQP